MSPATLRATRLADQRLAHARHVLQEHVLAGQQGHGGQPHHLALPQDDAADVLMKLPDQVFRFCARHGPIVTHPRRRAEGEWGKRAGGVSLRRRKTTRAASAPGRHRAVTLKRYT